MVRPRAFAEDIVLDAAMHRFWRTGYQGTSVRDLESATEMAAPRLYNAFGDKPDMFALSLARYLDLNLKPRIARLEAIDAPLVAIATFLREVAERALEDCEHRGCMLINAALEFGPSAPGGTAGPGRHVAAGLRQLEDFFRAQVTAGQRDGSITRRCSSEALSALLLSTLIGMRVLARARPDPALLEGTLQAALATLTPGTDETDPG